MRWPPLIGAWWAWWGMCIVAPRRRGGNGRGASTADISRHHHSLELGAGGGLVGLAVASGCTIDGPLFITDQETMFPLMEHNIAKNELNGRVKPAVLNWCVILRFLPACPPPPSPWCKDFARARKVPAAT